MEFRKIPYHICRGRQENIETLKVRQKFDAPRIGDVAAHLVRELYSLRLPDICGKRIAVTAGSRGISNIALVTKTTLDFLKSQGAVPFLVPAMGSHGGGTAEGQKKVLHGYGITEETTGAAIVSDMQTVQIGETIDALPIYCDKNAFAADYIVVINRVKAHSDFKAAYESGICKMTMVGLGKQEGATIVHKAGSLNFGRILPEAADVFIATRKILFAVALVKNAKEEMFLAECLMPSAIKRREKELLAIAKESQARLLVGGADLLLIDEIGKNISGAGMDPNVTGRPPTGAPGFPEPPASRIAALGITPCSEGNGIGVGMADMISLELARELDLAASYTNALTAGVPAAARIPVVANDDRDLLDIAVLVCGKNRWSEIKMIHIKNTLELEEIEVTANLLCESASFFDKIEVRDTESHALFDSQGRIRRFSSV